LLVGLCTDEPTQSKYLQSAGHPIIRHSCNQAARPPSKSDGMPAAALT
jgi:hypothetical protein